jgi:hypothetical protein
MIEPENLEESKYFFDMKEPRTHKQRSLADISWVGLFEQKPGKIGALCATFMPVKHIGGHKTRRIYQRLERGTAKQWHRR